jgi:hypothetical protein
LYSSSILLKRLRQEGYNVYTIFVGKPERKRSLGNLVVDGTIILKRYGKVVPALKHHAMKTCEEGEV